MLIAKEECEEINWWVENAANSFKHIIETEPNVVIETDASNIGWGAVCDNVTAGGLWSQDEQKFHINYLEMLAISFGLKALLYDKNTLHV
eukprot:gene1543-1706_t